MTIQPPPGADRIEALDARSPEELNCCWASARDGHAPAASTATASPKA